MRVASWALAALLLGCTQPPREVPLASPDRPPPAEEDDALLPPRVVDALIRETEAARELEFLEPVRAVTMTSEELRALVRQELADLELGVASQIMEAFGFIPPGLDLARQMEDLLSAEVLGMYDAEEDQLVVLRSVAGELTRATPQAMMARMVLIHELTHALQDQHFETLEHTGEQAWSDDGETVYSCLAEGDATLTMVVAVIQQTGQPDRTMEPGFRQQLRGQSEGAMPGSSALQEAPPYFGHVMGAMYLEGAGFLAELRRLGGYHAVDEAHRRPPRATRDVLHTEAYLRARVIWQFELPERLETLESAGLRRVATARLGELETSAFFLPLGDVARARAIAEGWAGDTFSVFVGPAGERALVWRLRFEDEAEAQEFVDASEDLAVAVDRGGCETTTGQGGQGPIMSCFGGRDRVERRGVDVVLVRGVPVGSAQGLAEALFAAPAERLEASPPQPSLLARFEAQALEASEPVPSAQ